MWKESYKGLMQSTRIDWGAPSERTCRNLPHYSKFKVSQEEDLWIVHAQ